MKRIFDKIEVDQSEKHSGDEKYSYALHIPRMHTEKRENEKYIG